MSKDFTVKDFIGHNYILDWLSGSPKKAGAGIKANSEKRIESIIRTLHKETDKNILKFKPRQK
ncbi:MAG: hypothetical protein HY954_02515 [Deltaproteobacteria bacterium]|nr:hypothetical protein [Deltaproteobacteria bacterium]